jgi:hypothetical protein
VSFNIGANLLIRATNLPNTCNNSAISVGSLRLAKGNENENENRKITYSKQFFHTPDSSGKPLSEAKSLERIATSL